MSEPTSYERALREQIELLQAELDRIDDERKAAALAATPATPDSPLAWALRDPGFRQWLLRRQLEREAR